MKLNVQAVRTQELDPGKSEAIFFDDEIPGFGLRLRKHGSRTFIFQYKLGTKQRRMALGKATVDRLAEVRKTADKLYARVKHFADDPAADKAEAKAAAPPRHSRPPPPTISTSATPTSKTNTASRARARHAAPLIS